MDFTQKSIWFMESAEGYRVVKALNGRMARYSALWMHGKPGELKTRYRQNEAIPQPFLSLGVFDTADEAKKTCEAHYSQQRQQKA